MKNTIYVILGSILYLTLCTILLITGCQYVFVQPPPTPAGQCKDPIYAEAYDHADEVISYLPSTVEATEKGAMRQALVNNFLEKFGANNPLDAQMDARRNAMIAYYNKYGRCPIKVTSGPMAQGFFVTLEGIDGKRWNYDTTAPGVLTESKW